MYICVCFIIDANFSGIKVHAITNRNMTDTIKHIIYLTWKGGEIQLSYVCKKVLFCGWMNGIANGVENLQATSCI